MKKHKKVTIYALIPSFFTILSICVGVSAIRYAMAGSFKFASILLVIAAILDLIDGRLARMLNSVSDFGAQLDSLADAVNFGVVPSIMIYLWAFESWRYNNIGWAAVVVFTCCGILRLARFNVQMLAVNRLSQENGGNIGSNKNNFSKIIANKPENSPTLNSTTNVKFEGKNKKTPHFFTGIPITIAAFLFVTPLFLSFKLMRGIKFEPAYLVLYSLMLGLLMVSRVPTLSTKHIRIHQRYIPSVLGILALLIAFILLEPWITLPLFAAAYLLSIPVTCLMYLRHK